MLSLFNEAMTHGLPESIFYQYLRANYLYPQASQGIVAMAGDAAVQTVLSGQASWEGITSRQPSEAQVEVAITHAKRIHDSLNIPYTLSESPLDQEDGMHYFTTERVASLLTAWDDKTTIVSAYFASSLLPDKVPGLPPELDNQKGRATPEMHQAVSLLFNRRFGFIRSEALALGGMFTTVREVLGSKPARVIARDYRFGLRALIDDLATTDQNHTKAAYKPLRSVLVERLHPLVADGLDRALPQIKAMTGVAISDNVVEQFIYNLALDGDKHCVQ
jgi:hypothetical protein